MEEYFIKIFRFIGILSIFALLYFIFAGVWGINFTNIESFNMKGAVTAILTFFMTIVVIAIFD